KDFYLGVYEVTQKEYKAIMGTNPSFFSKDGKGADKVKGLNTDNFPVETVSWQDAQDFLKKLNEREKGTLGEWKYSLPTEAQWEYACRGGAASYKKYHFGDTISAKEGKFNNTKGRTEKVGSYAANAFGLHDMHGNVWEWCLDHYDQDYYTT